MKIRESRSRGTKEVWADAELWSLAEEQAVVRGEKQPLRVRCKVDTGSWQCVLPESVATSLGLPLRERNQRVRYADGRVAQRAVALGLRVRVEDRDIETYAIVERDCDKVLLGTIALEDLGFDIDMIRGRLVPSPGTEDGPISVID